MLQLGSGALGSGRLAFTTKVLVELREHALFPRIPADRLRNASRTRLQLRYAKDRALSSAKDLMSANGDDWLWSPEVPLQAQQIPKQGHAMRAQIDRPAGRQAGWCTNKHTSAVNVHVVVNTRTKKHAHTRVQGCTCAWLYVCSKSGARLKLHWFQ